MKPEKKSHLLLGVTRSKAKMFEYSVPDEFHIKIAQDPAKLFGLSIGILGDLVAHSNSSQANNIDLTELRNNLRFSAYFFDSYLQSHLNAKLDPYLTLLGAASYYLCDLPGSSLVLTKTLDSSCEDIGGEGLEDLLLWLLRDENEIYFKDSEGIFGKTINLISHQMTQFNAEGTDFEGLVKSSKELREIAYANGTPRQLLLADTISSIIERRCENSCWSSLPKYSGLSKEKWLNSIQKSSFIKEFWPAQHLLGQNEILKGKSAIVQMPTSAGKTKATELIIRSAFLSDRASLAIIVAPFRALCHEIKNSLVESFKGEPVNVDELSDVLQLDFDILEASEKNKILVVTPEKLLYVLRHTPEIAGKIGLIIYDEGHQFDSGVRGITFELLITSLKSMIPKSTQTVLLSAVISNAKAIGNWLNGEDSRVVSGTNLIPIYRTVAFASWLDPLGRLEFVDQHKPDHNEFFVPRIIEQYELQLKGRERIKRLFPTKNDGQSIALYLGIKLVKNGGVAIFCGKKNTVSKLSESAVDKFERNLNFPKPCNFSDKAEIDRLSYLIGCNMGVDASVTNCAKLGIFTHHGNTPQGIRLSVEHAMKSGQIKFIICTSTLAQGVNLPIRYLIVTSVYQGAQRIKVRDFHNLLGRAGRAGMHTEGSVLFADPDIYDRRITKFGRYKWAQVKELLDPKNSEPCGSTLLTLFEPFYSDDGKSYIIMEPLDFTRMYIEKSDKLLTLPESFATKHADKKFTVTGLKNQISYKTDLVSSIENFLMAHWDESESELQKDSITKLAESTLAFSLADEEKKKQLVELFLMLAQNIHKHVSDASRREVFGKTLYGVWSLVEIEKWISEHYEELASCKDSNELLVILWEVINNNIKNASFRKCNRPKVLLEIAQLWIKGKPFYQLHEYLLDKDVRIIAGTQLRQYKLDHTVDICENAFAFDGTLVISAIIELITFSHPDSLELLENLKLIQKRLKYGLPNASSISLYELGFSDRVISLNIVDIIGSSFTGKNQAISNIRKKKNQVIQAISKYPSYYIEMLNNMQ